MKETDGSFQESGARIRTPNSRGSCYKDTHRKDRQFMAIEKTCLQEGTGTHLTSGETVLSSSAAWGGLQLFWRCTYVVACAAGNCWGNQTARFPDSLLTICCGASTARSLQAINAFRSIDLIRWLPWLSDAM